MSYLSILHTRGFKKMLQKEYSSVQGKTVKTQGLHGPSHMKGAKTELAQRTNRTKTRFPAQMNSPRQVCIQQKWTKHCPVFQGCLRDTSPHQDGNTSHDRNFCSTWCIFRHYLAIRIRRTCRIPSPSSKTTELSTGFQETSSQNTKYPHSTCFHMSFYCCHSTVWS